MCNSIPFVLSLLFHSIRNTFSYIYKITQGEFLINKHIYSLNAFLYIYPIVPATLDVSHLEETLTLHLCPKRVQSFICVSSMYLMNSSTEPMFLHPCSTFKISFFSETIQISLSISISRLIVDQKSYLAIQTETQDYISS